MGFVAPAPAGAAVLAAKDAHDVTAERWQTEFKVLDKITDRTGTLSTRATFAVEAGNPRVVPA